MSAHFPIIKSVPEKTAVVNEEAEGMGGNTARAEIITLIAKLAFRRD